MLEEEVARAGARGVTIEYGPDPETLPHEAPDLEELIPRDLTEPPLEVTSVKASTWGSSLLNRVLKNVGVRARDAAVANGIGGRGGGTITVTLTSVPGVAAARLWIELPTLAKLAGANCSERSVADRTVIWCSREEFNVANWVRDELIASASAQSEKALEELVARLP